MRISVIQKYKLGEEVVHNGRVVRIGAFRYEIRPMAIFKIYECYYIDEDGGSHNFDTAEHLLKSIEGDKQ